MSWEEPDWGEPQPEINYWEGDEGYWVAANASPEELAYAYEGGWGEEAQVAAAEHLHELDREASRAEQREDTLEALDRGAVDIEAKIGRPMTEREYETYVKGAQLSDIAGSVKEALDSIQAHENTSQGRLQVMAEEAEANGLGAGRKSWAYGEDREEPEDEGLESDSADA